MIEQEKRPAKAAPLSLCPRMTRKQAVEYILNVHGVPITVATSAKYATTG
ncbi:MAG: hypothetical protein FD149_2720 [Rhodospirillaceae bacterium]|nr:MAG: hypothetical protein FD149_2720 [Rhodospirillaceae bacterium]